MGKATPIRLLVSMLTQLRCIVMVAFTRLGVFKSAEEAAYAGERSTTTTTTNNNNNYVLMSDGSSPFPVPVPVPILTTTIKNMLPIVQYANFLEKPAKSGFMHPHDSSADKEGKVCCSVCWDCIEGNHPIRELCNCSHLFHRECLDRWVDEGRVTCPLCRTMLLPANTNPWLVLRNAHLSSQQDPIQIPGTTS
ncbi:RING-H2 finger protein [Actinidia chinensis var. chinensis]|uniref:RING-H2 finger protein n=1 Tax=Actinidia chinensis var. chinensis TaxID=1590841 RepID=A0A2R6QMX5_ACTCC|nr:RING-H2 finger protein [Actinidia chinensis var. chinensis]